MATTDFRAEAYEHEHEMGVVGLLKELRDESVKLLRQEASLAKTEVSEKAAKFARNAAYLAAGAAVALIGAIFILTAVSNLIAVGLEDAGMSQEVARWLAPFIVGAVMAGLGFAFVTKAIATFRTESVVPEKTVETIKENKEWLESKVS
jgi:hypothetical protein